MSKRAIIVVDLQNDYLASGKFPLVGIDTAVDAAARLVADARQRGEMVVNVRHEGPEGEPFFVAGTRGAEFIPAMAPKENEAVIVKNYPNSFRETDLDNVLRSSDVDEVVVIGAMSHMCIDATARAAADLGYKVVVAGDACATRELEFNGDTVPAAMVHASFMSALAFAYAQVVSVDELLAR